MSFIPVVNLALFTLPSTPNQPLSSRLESAQALTEACRTLGFACITGHGVPPELLDDAFAWSKKLFDLPHEEKMKAPHPPGPIPHRGYSHPGLEKVYAKELLTDSAEDGAVKGEEQEGKKIRAVKDFKESYEIGSSDNPAQPNIWLPEATLPHFRSFMMRFYWELNKTARAILEALALGLGLTEEEKARWFTLHSGHNNQLRLLHYPEVERERVQEEVVRMGGHADWSTFTLLFQDECGGLELQDPRQPGKFLAATPTPGTLVLNVGDMLQRFSNDLFPSALHRVTLAPPQPNSSITQPRFSIPYFVAVDDDALVECLTSTVSAERPARYEPIVFRDYGAWVAKYSYEQDGKGK